MTAVLATVCPLCKFVPVMAPLGLNIDSNSKIKIILIYSFIYIIFLFAVPESNRVKPASEGLNYIIYPHCSAIAFAIPGKVLLLNFARSGLGAILHIRCSLPSTTLVGYNFGNPNNHKQVDFVSP